MQPRAPRKQPSRRGLKSFEAQKSSCGTDSDCIPVQSVSIPTTTFEEPPMRIGLVAAVLSLALAPSPQPQKIVFARVFPQPGQIGLFIAAADGSNEHPLLAVRDVDYDAAWSPDGGSIVFTSERDGSADLYRVKPDGSGIERLTDSPAYDDQAAFSPDGRQLVFVTT